MNKENPFQLKNSITLVVFVIMLIAAGLLVSNVKNKTTQVAEVVEMKEYECDFDPSIKCTTVTIRLPDKSTFDMTYDGQTVVSLGATTFKKGQKVLASVDSQGNKTFLGPVRHDSMFILVIVFIGIVLFVTGMQGLRSIISLALSIFMVFFVYVPAISSGANPVQ